MESNQLENYKAITKLLELFPVKASLVENSDNCGPDQTRTGITRFYGSMLSLLSYGPAIQNTLKTDVSLLKNDN